MVRASRCVCVAVAVFVFSGCGPAKVEPTLDVTARPRAVDNKGGKSTITVSAVDALGKAGTGKVTVTSSVGSLKAGADATLSGGSADFEFSCDLSADATCVGSAKIDASWSTTDGVKVTAQTSISITAPPVPDGGKPDAGTVTGVLDGGTFGEYSIGLIFEKPVLLKMTGDKMTVSAKLVKTASPDAGVAGATVTFSASGGASFGAANTPTVTAVTDASGTATVSLLVDKAAGVTTVTAAAFDATAYQQISVVNAVKIKWLDGDTRTKTTLTVRSTGVDSSTNAYFKVTDAFDLPVVGVDVSFSIRAGSPAGSIVTPSARTNSDGIAQANLATGEAAGLITVQAVVSASELIADALFTVVLGRASDGRFDLSCSRKTLGAMQIQNPPRTDQSTDCKASFTDRSGNDLPFAIDVSWLSEAGTVPSMSRSDQSRRTATINFSTTPGLPVETAPLLGEPSNGPKNPRDMFVTIVAAMKGEEQFWDGSGNGVQNGAWDPGEWFVDLPEPFADMNDDGTWNPGEPYLNTEHIDCVTHQKLVEPPQPKWDGPNGCWDGDTTIWRATHVAYTTGFSIIEFSPPTTMLNDSMQIVPYRLYDAFYNRVSNDMVSVSGSNFSNGRGSIAVNAPNLGENFGQDLEYYTPKGTQQSDGGIVFTGTCTIVGVPAAGERCFRGYRFNSWKSAPTSGTVLLTAPPPNAPEQPSTTTFQITAGNSLEAGTVKYPFSVFFPK